MPRRLSAGPDRYGFAFIVLLFSVGCCNALAATPAAEREAALKQVRDKIESLRREITATQTQHDNARTELAEIERRIGEVHKILRRIQRDLNTQQARLLELQKHEAQLKQELAAQRELLARQMRAAYMIGRQEQLKLWLNQEDPAAIGRTNQYYRYLHRARAERIETARTTVHKLTGLAAKIETESTALRRLQTEHEGQRRELQARSQSRAALVAQLRRELAGKEQTLVRSLEDERRLQRLLTAIREAIPDILAAPGQRKSFAGTRGHLPWPVSGKVLNAFGKRRQSGHTKTNGVTILGDEGREIRAISHGRVAFADWLKGYGLLLILDHGNGYMSLYGQTQSIYKETGEWVEAGDVIASLGRSGGEEQAGLYFEIRHNGKPLDPARWCRAGR